MAPRRTGVVLAAVLALLAVLVVPNEGQAQTEAAGGWSQAAADAANTNRAVADGPSDPGLRWAVDLEAIVTDEAPRGYTAGGQGAVHQPVIGPGGDVIVPVANPEIGGRSAFVALDPDTGEVTFELQRRAGNCAPAVDSRERIWAVMNFDYDEATSTNSLRAFDADGQELDESLFDLTELGVASPASWCSFSTGLHLAGQGPNEYLVLFHVPDNRHIAALDLSGDTPSIAWQLDAEDAAVPFDRFENSSHGSSGGGPSARLAAMTDTQLIVPVRTGEEHQLAFLELATGQIERVVDLPAFTVDGEPREAPPRGSVTVMVVGDTVVASLADRGDYAGVLHGVSLTGTSTSPDWTQLLPSDTRNVNGAQVMAVSNGTVVVPTQADGQLGFLQGHDAATGEATAWANSLESSKFDPQLVTDASGAIYATYWPDWPASRAINLVRYGPDGQLNWEVSRPALLGQPDEPATDEFEIGPIDAQGTLYARVGSLLHAIDDSGGLGRQPRDRVQDLWLLADITAVDEQGNERQLLDELVDELAADAEDPIALSEHHAFTPTPALGAQLVDSQGTSIDGVEVITGLLALTSLPEDSDVPEDLIGEATLMVVATATSPDVHVASGDQLTFDDTGLTTLAGVNSGHLTRAFAQTLPSGEEPGLDPLETLERRWQQGSVTWVTDDEEGGPAFRIAMPFQRDASIAVAGTARPRTGGGPISTAVDKGMLGPTDVLVSAGCAFAGIAVGTLVGAGTLGVGGVAAGVAITSGCVSLRLGNTLSSLPEAIDKNEPPRPPLQPGGPQGLGFGDPHLATFDGLDYDLHGQGEFHLVRGEDLEIQIRIAPWGTLRNLAIITEVALDVAGDVIVTDAGQLPSTITINGEQVELPRSHLLDLPAGGSLTRWGGEVLVAWPDGTLVEVFTTRRRGIDTADVRVSLAPERAGEVVGLLGDADGDPDNDLTTADGQVLDDPDFTTFYDVYAESWRVDADDNLFDELTHDRSLPERQTTLADLDDDRVAWARALCTPAGLTDAFLEACLIDVAATGDATFAATAATAQAAVRPGTLHPDLPPVDDPELPEPDEPEECGTSFVDVTDANVHACAIDQLRERDITLGVGDGRYDPTGTVTRGQFATFLVRALGLDPVADGPFDDTAGNVHEPQINAAAAAGITQGVTATSFAPDRQVTRGQVAALLTRAFDLDPVDDGPFDDIAGHTHEGRINAAYAAGITQGVSATSFAPDRELRRDQMASLLIRALDAAQDL